MAASCVIGKICIRPHDIVEVAVPFRFHAVLCLLIFSSGNVIHLASRSELESESVGGRMESPEIDEDTEGASI